MNVCSAEKCYVSTVIFPVKHTDRVINCLNLAVTYMTYEGEGDLPVSSFLEKWEWNGPILA